MTALALPPAHLPARPSPLFDADRAMQLAARTFEIEARALLGMGMGMGGHVGRKIAATPASTGTSAFCAPGRGQPRRPRHGGAR